MEREGFPLIKRIPSSEAKRFLLGYQELDASKRALLKSAIAARGAVWWGARYDYHASTPEARMFDEFLRMHPYPSWIHDSVGCLAKAPELRKVARLAFQQLLGARPEKAPVPGDWHCHGEISGKLVSVQVSYSTQMGQVLYGLELGKVGRHHTFNFESLYGVGIGRWDLIAENRADEAFAILKEIVQVAVSDCAQIDAIKDG